ncbi:hypothetical protein Np050604_150 [Cyanophage S-RIM44]|uniref:Uncharacterized protein n=2 Tax=Vellamovirus TaxID=2733139 RepID=A0A127KMU0_9CAUD|nr:hypothetical protein Syn1_152 [Prochlorococcus phage Syn1]AMO43394.1 hypothetical protein W270710_150 [Cyanophage S-RIM44]ADO99253.1 hypothetical protein Syn1_152 [Prochlorococcus phage Syn1]AOO11866.1 hypothetical protein Np050604_150 [Cyanophage S-RIM44]AOO12567.1 hypothetical protein Sn080709_150 [Cyanophage S-RIM44]AOO13033.1 hypothetical protein W2100709_151 [Cyanophage S-RIM44]
MADQIIVFKNGERVITDLQEVFEGEEESRRGICLQMSNPYILELVSSNDPSGGDADLQVKFSKWNPYSIDYKFRVPYDTVLAIGEPDTGLAQAYRNKIASLVATQGNEDIPQWEEGKPNPNTEAQLADINLATSGAVTDPTAGVNASPEKHPIATPFVTEESAETSEV